MNEIQKKEQVNAGSTAVVAGGGFNFFDPVQFDTAQRVCKVFASSELVPDMYKASKSTPEKAVANCMIALNIANRLDADPLMIMQSMVPIYGRPSWSASFLIATVNTCGRFAPLKFRFTEKGMLGSLEYDERLGGRLDRKQFDGKKIMDVECMAYTTEKGSDEVLEGSPISIRMAVLEGWYTKSGSKWQTMPRQMLMYRAAAFWVRAYAPELSLGMHTIEENQDIAYTDYEDVTSQVEAEKRADANKEEIGMEESVKPVETKPAAATAEEERKEPPQSQAAPVADEPQDTPEEMQGKPVFPGFE